MRVVPNDDPLVALQLERAMGWPRTENELARRFRVARGFVALDPEPVGTVCLAEWGETLAWVGGMAVLSEARGRGIGRALLDACLAATNARSVGLDATEAGRGVYAKAGFREVSRTMIWKSEAAPQARPSKTHSLHPISISEAMEIGEYDAARFGAKRLPALMDLMHAAPWHALMSRERATGNVSGFVFGHEKGMGPVVADDDEAAAALVAACAVSGAPQRILVDANHPSASRVFASLGFVDGGFACTRMVRGADLPMRLEACYAPAAWALG